MTPERNRKIETCCYLAMWALVAAVFILSVMRARSYTGGPLLDWHVFTDMVLSLLPFLAIFIIHNYLLIPKLLLRNKYRSYLIATIGLIVLIWFIEVARFAYIISRLGPPPPGAPAPWMRPLGAIPIYLDFIYDVLVVGVNLATALLFQRYDDRLKHESLMKSNAQSQLSYLKGQINPHFYMNMLNNIHGMIEINPEKAQEMVLDMSRLMRYMLYDSSKTLIGLAREIDFLSNYIDIMRQRYPESKVHVTTRFPSGADTAGIYVPPLLFLVYIENAFKHGVSYRDVSFVSVSISVAGGKVVFKCLNSCHPAGGKDGGIGLHNARQRLNLIYGDSYDLDIRNIGDNYSVELKIPAHENTDSDN